jgi:hypothetical protein
MNAWNLIAFALIVITLIEARQNGWGFPKLVSFATVTGLYLAASLALKLVS